MGPIDALLHLLNFLVAPVAIGLALPGAAKLLWRGWLGPVGLARLWRWTVPAAVAAAVAALVLLGHDGRMAGYLGVIAAAALALQIVAGRAAPKV